MTRLQLPDEAIEGIAPLGRIPPDAARSLAIELEEVKPAFGVTENVKAVVRRSSSIALDDEGRDSLALAIVGVHYIRQGLGKRIEEVVSEIVEEFGRAVDSASPVAVTTDEVNVLRTNVATILGIKGLYASVKSSALRSDYGNVYSRSKIYTDVRPVFDDELTDPLLASLLTHTIRLSVLDDGEPKTIYLMADSGDLLELQRQITRAIDKAHALAGLLGGRWGPPLDQEQE